jgi:hypothetical protein
MKKNLFFESGLMLILISLMITNLSQAQNPPIVQWPNSHNFAFGSHSTNASDWTYSIINTDGGNNYVAVGYTWTGGDGTGDCDDPAACYNGNSRTAVA